jgi:hypothetical protein
MRCSRCPDLADGQFTVGAASSPAEIDAAISLVSEAHKVPRSLFAPIFGSVAMDERSAVWFAWDETEAVSTVWMVTLGGVVAVVEVMTPERHQRRGAGRQLLAAAVHDLWPEPGGQALLLSSAAGRRLYESHAGMPATLLLRKLMHCCQGPPITSAAASSTVSEACLHPTTSSSPQTTTNPQGADIKSAHLDFAHSCRSRW